MISSATVTETSGILAIFGEYLVGAKMSSVPLPGESSTYPATHMVRGSSVGVVVVNLSDPQEVNKKAPQSRAVVDLIMIYVDTNIWCLAVSGIKLQILHK